MWVTRDGHVLGILGPYFRALAMGSEVPEKDLLGELGRLARSARHVGVLRHARSGARYPVFAASSGGRLRRLITRPATRTASPSSPPSPIPWRRWPGRPWWPPALWPGYLIIDVDPPLAPTPQVDPLGDDDPDDDPDDPGDPDDAQDPDEEPWR
jgi:hypothetical protein